jgi:integrase
MARKRSGAHTITVTGPDGQQTAYRRNRKRYANGKGSVYQRSRDGKWVAALPLGDGKTKTWVCRTEAEAEVRLQEGLEQLGQGIALDTKQMTLGEWLDHWFDTRVVGHKAPTTVESYRYFIRVHLKPATLARIPLTDVRTEHIAALLAEKATERSRRNGRAEGKTLSRSTVLKIHALLSGALEHAVAVRRLRYNPANHATPPRPEREKVHALTPGETEALRKAVNEHRLGPLFALCLETGLREGEAIGLTWDRVAEDGSYVVVDQQLQLIQGRWTLCEPKRSSIRKVGLTQTAREILQQIRDRQAREAASVGEDWGATWDQLRRAYRETVWAKRPPQPGLIFTTASGGPLHRSTATHAFQDCLRRAGIESHRFHFLRHQNASFLLTLGVSPRDLQDHLGHADFATTMNTYAHLVPDATTRIAAVVDAARARAQVHEDATPRA